MATETITAPAQAHTATPVPAAQAAPVGDTAKKRTPSDWYKQLCPKVAAISAHSEKLPVQKFNIEFAGAKATGKWEDEWPMLTKDEFLGALDAVGKIEIGGHNPDGTHPRAPKSKE